MLSTGRCCSPSRPPGEPCEALESPPQTRVPYGTGVGTLHQPSSAFIGDRGDADPDVRDALVAWEPRARPVPATLDDVAATVLETGDDALLVDPAGPVPFVIGDDLIAELAQGRRLVELEDGGFGWAFLDTSA